MTRSAGIAREKYHPKNKEDQSLFPPPGLLVIYYHPSTLNIINPSSELPPPDCLYRIRRSCAIGHQIITSTLLDSSSSSSPPPIHLFLTTAVAHGRQCQMIMDDDDGGGGCSSSSFPCRLQRTPLEAIDSLVINPTICHGDQERQILRGRRGQ